jgi:hypothetical protein
VRKGETAEEAAAQCAKAHGLDKEQETMLCMALNQRIAQPKSLVIKAYSVADGQSLSHRCVCLAS